MKDTSWKACQKLFGNADAILQRLRDFRNTVDAGAVPAKNIKRVRKILQELGHLLNPAAMKSKSVAASHLCRWLISTVAYCEHANLVHNETYVSNASPRAKTASEACKYICKADVVEIKSLSSPPQPVTIVCMCICILLGKHENAGWAGAKAMLSDPSLLKTLIDHKREDVTTEQVEEVRKLLSQDEALDGDRMKAVSKAAYGLLQWVLAMIDVV